MFIDVPQARLFVVKHGRDGGTPIVAVGGWIGSSELWTDPLAYLSDEYLTVAYDHRGSGLSVCDASAITFDALVGDTLAVMDACGIARGVLAAESPGALTALAVASRHPDRVSHLVIVDGLYSRGVPVEPDPFLQALRSAYADTLEGFVQRCVPEPDSEHIKAWGRKILARAQPDAAMALRMVGSTADLAGDLPGVTQPTLALHGDRDTIVPLEAGRSLAAALPDAEFQVLPGCGHVPTLTRPRVVADAIRAFLSRRLRRG